MPDCDVNCGWPFPRRLLQSSMEVIILSGRRAHHEGTAKEHFGNSRWLTLSPSGHPYSRPGMTNSALANGRSED